MNTKIKSFLATVASVLLILMLGSACVMDAITPCFIEPETIIYSGKSPTSWMPYTTLWDMEQINAAMDFKHTQKQIELARESENDNLCYSFLKDRGVVHLQDAREFQKAVFSPEGAIGLLVPALSGGLLGALLIKRPGDKSPKEQKTNA